MSVADGASMTVYNGGNSPTTCSGTASGPFTAIPSDGSCQPNPTESGSSATLLCSRGGATLNIYLNTNCTGTAYITGSGAGDGNTCIALSVTGPTGVGSAKINCNLAFLTASLSFFSIIVAIFLASFLQ